MPTAITVSFGYTGNISPSLTVNGNSMGKIPLQLKNYIPTHHYEEDSVVESEYESSW